MLVFFIIVGLSLLAVVSFAGLCLALPAISEALERARLQREAAEASWRIHQQAAEAFGQMLEAARREDRGEL